LAQLLERNLSDQLNEYAYIAELAGLSFSVIIDSFGISVLVSGYNQKLPLLVLAIFDRLRSFKCDANRFLNIKEQVHTRQQAYATNCMLHAIGVRMQHATTNGAA
jgi:insulysin